MSLFPAIHIEGGLLGPDTLEQLLAGELPGLRPKDFGLEGRRSLTDEIASVFADARAEWEVFQRRLERLPEGDPATSVTRDAWMIPFLSLLGYELRYNQRAYEVDGVTFAISHRAGEAETAPPVHIVGWRQELGRLAPSGRPRLSPHALVQEYLNRSEALWGLVTNGRTLRLLRDTTYVRRQAYVEFDLRQIFEEQRFTDFAVLYRLLHRTRLPRSAAEARNCLLEQYYQHALEQGGRVRERLRDGVEECIKCLANGFLSHPDNAELRQRVARSDEDIPLAAGHSPLAPEELYRQLLRLVYRLLFLLVSEDRGLISGEAIYREHYGVARLRRLLERRSTYTEHDDIWCSLRVLWKVLSDEQFATFLGAPPLNGELFAPLDLDSCSITNCDFLEAFWHLAYYRESPSAPPRRVNYAALDVEELGSVYESLLEYHPQIDTSGGVPRFELAFGSDRKSTGSYYTPPELVAELIRSALEPVIEERLEDAKRMATELQRVASGEWRVVSQKITELFGEGDGNSIISRFGSLAERDAVGRTGLSSHLALPSRGAIRVDKPDAASSNLSSGEHRRGLGSAGNEGVSPISEYRGRQSERAGDVHSAGTTGGTIHSGADSVDTGVRPGAEQTNGESSAQPEEAVTASSLPEIWGSLPFATRHSLLARALAEHALLSIRVCDPAAGSGHFLLAAARRLGKELARVRTGEDEPAPERVREAIRDVVGHCIYGVDKNPLAVELCRVALWLEAHCEGKPLTFLDHRIKCGDSLVGVVDLAVLKEGIPDDAFEPVSGDDRQVARSLKKKNQSERTGQYELPFDARTEIEHAAVSIRPLLDTPDDSPAQIRKKAQALRDWERQSERDRTACDLWTAAFFQPLAGYNPPPITSDTLRGYLETGTAHGQTLGAALASANQHRFFHWPLEFPEVFAASSQQRAASSEPHTPLAIRHSPLADSATRHSPLANSAGFDVVIGNPPFMGGLKISGNLGDKYRHWLEVTYDPYGGTADLCAAFYRRAYSLLKLGGRMGMVATNTIGQGDTRESGLAVLLRQGGAITFARRFIKWPGAANVEVNLVAIHKPHHSPLATRHSPILDGHPVPAISSRLDADPEAEPTRLKQNEGKAFIGDFVRGIGFVLEPGEAEALIAKDPRNADCLFPYLNGEDLNSHPEQQPSRWVICFHDWDLERARQYPDLLRMVEERVRPERERLTGPGDKRNREYWWQFGAYRAGMRQAIAPLRRVLVRSRVSELHAMVFVSLGWIYNEQTIVFAFDDDYHFALLQSSVHEVWLRQQASSLRTDIRYTPTDCFDTFAFPPAEYERAASGEQRVVGAQRAVPWRSEDLPEPFQRAARVGAVYHEHRHQIMLARKLGLTKTYNLFHDHACTDADIVRLRELHAEMDRAILACYGWEDLEPGHDFYQNDRGQTRYTLSPDTRREVLARLVGLNIKIFTTTNGG